MFAFIEAADLHDEAGLLDNVTPICGLKEPGPDHFTLDLLASNLNHNPE